MIGVLLGNHVGGGHGKTLATIAGAVGGGYIGNEVEKRTRECATEKTNLLISPQQRSNAYRCTIIKSDFEIKTLPEQYLRNFNYFGLNQAMLMPKGLTPLVPLMMTSQAPGID